ncbi:hypothetical protein PM082_021605 [Marasmius tenuissimus]|nr:hypothetical protein PM082_021605 [Marasmius tenuissimus]
MKAALSGMIAFVAQCSLDCNRHRELEVSKPKPTWQSHRASSNTPGATVVIQDCSLISDGENQYWDYKFTNTVGRFGYLALQWNIFGDKCLDTKGGLNADGTQFQIWPCNDGNNNQLMTQISTGVYAWTGTNKCVGLTDDNMTNRNSIQVWTCDSQT